MKGWNAQRAAGLQRCVAISDIYCKKHGKKQGQRGYICWYVWIRKYKLLNLHQLDLCHLFSSTGIVFAIRQLLQKHFKEIAQFCWRLEKKFNLEELELFFSMSVNIIGIIGDLNFIWPDGSEVYYFVRVAQKLLEQIGFLLVLLYSLVKVRIKVLLILSRHWKAFYPLPRRKTLHNVESILLNARCYTITTVMFLQVKVEIGGAKSLCSTFCTLSRFQILPVVCKSVLIFSLLQIKPGEK